MNPRLRQSENLENGSDLPRLRSFKQNPPGKVPRSSKALSNVEFDCCCAAGAIFAGQKAILRPFP